MMQIALYKAPGTLADKAIRLFTGSPYSHCELVIAGMCCSSSIRDGGVRVKSFWLDPENWDVIDIPGDEAKAWEWFATHSGQAYDWWGVWRFVFPFLPHKTNEWFCSEACAAALSLPDAWGYTPQTLAEKYLK